MAQNGLLAQSICPPELGKVILQPPHPWMLIYHPAEFIWSSWIFRGFFTSITAVFLAWCPDKHCLAFPTTVPPSICPKWWSHTHVHLGSTNWTLERGLGSGYDQSISYTCVNVQGINKNIRKEERAHDSYGLPEEGIEECLLSGYQCLLGFHSLFQTSVVYLPWQCLQLYNI